ncbi:hypothetical protein K491DRAFT_681557 [Lophiostoma macrostomum CBS 122681]|uniref:Uncharacterized protein n=1 Tax=Lophiostoma macrostomum CBS 122681 TaxID=1314788 RepID=A0A6A6SZ37_9PLEO|nr:hypothetical protein K491DRAFT_681557 [Lophiostoma macrostomum CBS 122681]
MTSKDSLSEQVVPTGLPPHVSIHSPKNVPTSDNLLNAKIFTRLSISSSTTSAALSAAVSASSNAQTNAISPTFCLQHNNVLLVFDVDVEDERDLHHEHVRTVCLMLKDQDFSVDYARCVFDASTAQQAGFQFDSLAGGAVMVVNLMAMQDDDEDSSDEGDDEVVLEGDKEQA